MSDGASPFRGPGQADDLRLAQALKSGHPHIAADLNAAYGPWLYDYAYALLRDRDSAADAIHATLLTAQARAGTLLGPQRLRGWLYGLVRDECLARLADPARRPTIRQEAADAVAAATEDPARLAARRRTVVAALAELTGREREIADLTLRHGLGAVEVAEVLGITPEQANDQALATHDEIARILSTELGRPIDNDQLPGAMEVLPFAVAPAGPSDRVAAIPAPPPLLPASAAPSAKGARAGETPEKARLWPALAAAGAVVLLVALVYLVLPNSSKSNDSASTPAVTATPAQTATLTPDGTTPTDPGTTSAAPTPTTSTTTTAPAPQTTRHTTSGAGGGGGTHSSKPTHTTPGGNQTTPPSGGLTVDNSDCQYVAATAGPATCILTITAHSALHWSVVAGSSDAAATISASGSGSLAKGSSTTVTVTITPTQECNANGGGGNGAVTFSPTATAGVSYVC